MKTSILVVVIFLSCATLLEIESVAATANLDMPQTTPSQHTHVSWWTNLSAWFKPPWPWSYPWIGPVPWIGPFPPIIPFPPQVVPVPPRPHSPAPAPTPKPHSPAPAQTPKPKPHSPAPAPTPRPHSPAPAPTPRPRSPPPVVTPKPHTPAPAQTPKPKPHSPAPAPMPKPKPHTPAPAPAPMPSQQQYSYKKCSNDLSYLTMCEEKYMPHGFFAIGKPEFKIDPNCCLTVEKVNNDCPEDFKRDYASGPLFYGNLKRLCSIYHKQAS